MKGLYFVVGVVLALFLFEGSAQAGHRHRHQSVHHHGRQVAVVADPGCNIIFPCEGVSASPRGQQVAKAMGWFGSAVQHYTAFAPTSQTRHEHETRVASVGGRPSDCYGIPWCGCYLRHVFGLRDRSLNLAVKWAKVGHETSPHVGAIVVWRHHVGRIVAQEAGQWIVESGNDGHRVRARPRSLHGAIAFREL